MYINLERENSWDFYNICRINELSFSFLYLTLFIQKKIYKKLIFFYSRYFLGWHVYMSEHLDRYPLRSLKYSRFRSKSLKFLLRLKRWIVSRVKKKKKWKKNGISKAGLIRCTAFHEHESMKKHLCFLDFFSVRDNNSVLF